MCIHGNKRPDPKLPGYREKTLEIYRELTPLSIQLNTDQHMCIKKKSIEESYVENPQMFAN